MYGMSGIGLSLICLRILVPGREWNEGLIRFSFWSLNFGLGNVPTQPAVRGTVTNLGFRRARLLVRSKF
jgi:hypothetical protein